jgi:hypothetical protein
MYRLLVLIVLLVPVVSWGQEQDCTIKYLGVNTGQEEEGEPSVEMVHPRSFMGMGTRVNASYEATNVFHLYSLDIDRTVVSRDATINIFEFTCVTPE